MTNTSFAQGFLGRRLRALTLGTAALNGATSAIAQVVLIRELMVVLFGNEITVALALTAWLVGIAFGAALGRRQLSRRGDPFGVFSVHRCLALAGILLPIEVLLIRTGRWFLGVPATQYLTLFHCVVLVVVSCSPIAMLFGLVFPSLCHVLADARPRRSEKGAAASVVYVLEAIGSITAGAVLTFLLLPRWNALRLILFGAATGWAGAACAALVTSKSTDQRGRGQRRRIAMASAAALLAGGAALFNPSAVAQAASRLEVLRWRAFGLLGSSGTAAGFRLVATMDSPYQNLAVLECSGQYTVYGDGQVLFSFPDPISREHEIHYVMAQSPDAANVLMIGGNLVDDVRELLKYPLQRLVVVQTDAALYRLLMAVAPEAVSRVAADPRVEMVTDDGPRYVRRCPHLFDVILIHAPEPCSASANRYYTVEFFRHVQQRLHPEGFVTTTVAASERLETETVEVMASVYRALRRVFPRVLMTAESRRRFFAGGERSRITFDAAVLEERARRAKIPALAFRPEYFRRADELFFEKTEAALHRLRESQAAANTLLNPTTYSWQMMLWSRYSGSGVGRVWKYVRPLAVAWPWGIGLLAMFGLVAWTAGHQAARRVPREARARISVGLTAIWLGLTGFFAMAGQMLLVILFQGAYGHVYSRIGMISASFMLGLALGGRLGGWATWSPSTAIRVALAADVVLISIALGVPRFGDWTVSPAAGKGSFLMGEVFTYGLMVLLGGAVGTQFPCAMRFFHDGGVKAGPAAALGSLADHLGAAAGGFLAGVLLVPVLGLGGAAAFLGALKACGVLFWLAGQAWGAAFGNTTAAQAPGAERSTRAICG